MFFFFIYFLCFLFFFYIYPALPCPMWCAARHTTNPRTIRNGQPIHGLERIVLGILALESCQIVLLYCAVRLLQEDNYRGRHRALTWQRMFLTFLAVNISLMLYAWFIPRGPRMPSGSDVVIGLKYREKDVIVACCSLVLLVVFKRCQTGFPRCFRLLKLLVLVSGII